MPATLRIQFNVNQKRELDRTLVVHEAKSKDLRKPLNEVMDALERYSDEVFDAEGGAQGLKPWAQLTEPYASIKARFFPGKGILERTGKLRQSLAGNASGIRRVTNQKLTYGTSVSYAGYHQSGTGRMAKRPPLRLSMPMRNEIVEIIDKHLKVGE